MWKWKRKKNSREFYARCNCHAVFQSTRVAELREQLALQGIAACCSSPALSWLANQRLRIICGGPLSLRYRASLSPAARPRAGPPTVLLHAMSTGLHLCPPLVRLLLLHTPGSVGGPPTVSRHATSTWLRLVALLESLTAAAPLPKTNRHATACQEGEEGGRNSALGVTGSLLRLWFQRHESPDSQTAMIVWLNTFWNLGLDKLQTKWNYPRTEHTSERVSCQNRKQYFLP